MKTSLVTSLSIVGVLATGGAAFAANSTTHDSVDSVVPVLSTDTAVTPFAIVEEFNLDESNVEDNESFEDDAIDNDVNDIDDDADELVDDADELDDDDADELDDDDSDDNDLNESDDDETEVEDD